MCPNLALKTPAELVFGKFMANSVPLCCHTVVISHDQMFISSSGSDSFPQGNGETNRRVESCPGNSLPFNIYSSSILVLHWPMLYHCALFTTLAAPICILPNPCITPVYPSQPVMQCPPARHLSCTNDGMSGHGTDQDGCGRV